VGYLLTGDPSHPANFSRIDVPDSTETRALNISNSGLIVGDYTSSEGRRGFLFDGSTFTTIVDTFPGSTTTEIFAVTEAHTWVGVYIDAAKVRHGYIRHSSGIFTAIDFPGSSQTEAFALNDAGVVVGAYMLHGVQYGFLLSGEPAHPGNFQTIDFPGSTGTRAIGVNNAGEIVGDYIDANGVRHGFLATPIPAGSPRPN
jgi:hypothetical protein